MNDYKELVEKLRNAAGGDLGRKMCRDAADAIERLVKERDAFMDDFMRGYKAQVEKGRSIYRCDICKHSDRYDYCKSVECNGLSNFEWRGVQE